MIFKRVFEWNTNSLAIGFATVVFLVTLICLFVACRIRRCIKRRKKRTEELHSLTPLMSNRLVPGIRADQHIEFVVPTITLPVSTNFSVTEDSMSDSDYLGITSGSDREMHTRQRHPAGRYHISPQDISKGLYPEADERKEAEAKVGFLLHYIFHREQLLVTLLSASNIPLLEKKTKVCPMAEVVLLPEKTPKFFTKTHKNQCNPVFNEPFIFPAKRHTLDNRVLKISIWDYDRFSRKHFIGRVFYSLCNAGITSLVTGDVLTDEIWSVLSQRKNSPQPGEILLSLCYSPEEATLKVGVLKVRFINIKDISTVYVKLTVYYDKKRLRPRKSVHKKAQHEIEFNEIFDVHISRSNLPSVQIAVGVYGRFHNGIARQVFGKTRIGESCSLTQGVQHWFDMVQNSNSTIVQLHKLV